MRLKYHPRFEYFDPLEGEIPEPYGIDYFEIVQRARNLLKNRTSEQINQAALIINQLYRDPDFVDPQYQEFKQKTVKVRIDGEEIEAYITSNHTEALYKNRKNILLARYPEFPDAQWYELFAVITLSYVEKVCGVLQSRKDHANLPPDHWHKEVMGEQISEYDVREDLIFANQALTYAETLVNHESDIKLATQKNMSDKMRQAVNKRHAMKTGPLKDEVSRLHSEKYEKEPSVRKVASRIYKELTNTGAILVETNAQFIGKKSTSSTTNNDNEKWTVFFENKPALNTDEPEKRFEKWIAQFREDAKKNTRS